MNMRIVLEMGHEIGFYTCSKVCHYYANAWCLKNLTINCYAQKKSTSFCHYYSFIMLVRLFLLHMYAQNNTTILFWSLYCFLKQQILFLKLGTINVHHKRNKLNPLCCCHSNYFGSSLLLSKNQISHLQPPNWD